MSKSLSILQPNSDAPSPHAKCDKPSGLGFNFMEQEIWKLIEVVKPYYEVSSFGRIRSYKTMKKDGSLLSEPRIIKLCKDGRGYLNFTVRINGKSTVLPIHTQVAKAFINNENNEKLVRHLNDNKLDNRVENLAWGSYSDNMKDALRNKKNPKKHNFGHALILYIYNCEHNDCKVALRYNVSPSMVNKIRNGRSYSWLTGHNKK